MTGIGFPHSEISGSKRVCRSPKLNAAYHVLHRLLMPRHPLYALTSLTKIKSGQLCLTISISRSLSISCAPFSMQMSKNNPAQAGKTVSYTAQTDLVGVPGLEPGTSSLSGMRSNQLSYTPVANGQWSATSSNPPSAGLPSRSLEASSPPTRLRRLRRGSLFPLRFTLSEGWWRQPGSNR